MRGAASAPARIGALALIVAAPFACRGPKGNQPSTAASASTSASASVSTFASASTSASALVSAAPDLLALVPWPSLVAAEAWELAAKAIDALPPADQGSVAARLARLRAAVGRCTREEGERGVALAESLTTGAADVANGLVAYLRVDALICAGRAKEALAVTGPAALSARKGPRAAVLRARAMEESGDYAGARAAIGEAIDTGATAGLPIGTLINTRLRVLRKLPVTPEITKAIEADRKRLFVEFPLSFTETATAPTLDVAGWMKRADTLAGLGRTEDAMHALDAAHSAGGPAKKIARARAHALWKARSYARAATALKECATHGQGDEAIEDTFLAARATSRAGDDDAAIAQYEALALKHPSTRWGGEAAYLAAHLRWLKGKWQDAILAFDRYLQGKTSRAPNQEHNVREAKRARAFAYLEWGKHAEARRLFKMLAGSDTYASDAYAKGRLELLEAIAADRGGDKTTAVTLFKKLGASHAYGYLDLATRRRLTHAGESLGAWPVGPIPPLSLPALEPEARVLTSAGLVREALARIALPKDDPARCAIHESFEDGYEAYKLGLKVASDQPPDEANAWKWRCAWPSPYAAVVSALEAREGLPRGLLHAILRQESAFRVEVVSPAGAVGIAQLMPATALTTATAIGQTLDPTDIAALQAPFVQLDLSARHLHALFVELAGENATEERKRDAIPLVIGAYNAGAGAVKRWMKEAPGMDADVFIERTPFLETRGYVARVLGNLVHYAVIAGAPTPTLATSLPAPP